MRYTDSIKIPSLVSVSEVQHMEDFLRGIGSVDAPRGWEQIGFTVEADDLWDLAVLCAEIKQEAAAYGFDFEPTKEYAKDA